MSRLTVWNPWREMDRVSREVSELFNGDWWPALQRTAEFPLLNAWKKEGTLVITAELPGIDPAQIDLSMEGNSLTIAGKREGESTAKEDNHVRRERWSKSFKRTIELPFEVEPEKSEAKYEKGILTITLHRAPEREAKKLT